MEYLVILRLGSSEAGITFEGPVSIINNKETSFILSSTEKLSSVSF